MPGPSVPSGGRGAAVVGNRPSRRAPQAARNSPRMRPTDSSLPLPIVTTSPPQSRAQPPSGVAANSHVSPSRAVRMNKDGRTSLIRASMRAPFTVRTSAPNATPRRDARRAAEVGGAGAHVVSSLLVPSIVGGSDPPANTRSPRSAPAVLDAGKHTETRARKQHD